MYELNILFLILYSFCCKTLTIQVNMLIIKKILQQTDRIFSLICESTLYIYQINPLILSFCGGHIMPMIGNTCNLETNSQFRWKILLFKCIPTSVNIFIHRVIIQLILAISQFLSFFMLEKLHPALDIWKVY